MAQQIGSMAGQITPNISNANKDQYQTNRRTLNLGDKVAAMLNQADVERQWGMLQYAELQREQSNDMRRAFNYYTRQLNFNGDSYVLTASTDERKRMIRNDDLPTLTSVIASDLDLRDLYRNEYLTAIEDAVAEVAYQAKKQLKKNKSKSNKENDSTTVGGGGNDSKDNNDSDEDDGDVSDVIELMTQAHVAMSKWFALISAADVE
eukprot:CAMPEP_0204628534 /NCGR_PEP_ID=MMETSP0717-20131115/16074_1 /ASSEMBLY_ACC=CAM_ASM_000666 /TAXON_ID=230516 /ORGANISM="Chaetoceros curvisetus" /LENGTH=205 /DNA_ID=CAMNT_0051645179 /DNA_START=16 /DNA_END=630 /DNA_ORIENTATION=+